MTDRELKPCPFCGGDAERVDIAEGENAGGSCISCTACQASGNVEFGYKENFVSNWNRRASHNRERGEVKQLEWKFLSTPPSGEEYASTSLGTYFIELGYKRFPVKLHSYQLGTYDTLEEAKAAAQSDFASRIRSCLLDKPEAVEGDVRQTVLPLAEAPIIEAAMKLIVSLEVEILGDESSDNVGLLDKTIGEFIDMFEVVKGFELEVLTSGRPEWIIPSPPPRCKMAVRKDTKEAFVATGAYYKPLESIDDTTFRDSDGCTWRLLRNQEPTNE